MDIQLQTSGTHKTTTYDRITVVVSLSAKEIDALTEELKTGGIQYYTHYLVDGTRVEVRLQREGVEN